MKKILLWVVGVVIVGVVGFYALNNYIYKEKQGDGPALDYKNATYVIDGMVVKLTDGISEVEAAPGSASKITTQYFGNELKYDLNADGREDVVFLLTQQTGGTGTFYYVVAALQKNIAMRQGDENFVYVGSQGLLLGDRIAPQTTEVSKNSNHKGVIVVNYADRKPGEPMTTAPSVGKSIWLKLDPDSMQFGEVEQDFEGEADVSKMTLSMKEWVWVKTLLNDGKEIAPRSGKMFTVTFLKDGGFSAKTDCNSVTGKYVVDKEKIALSAMASTKMYCEGSQEVEFTKMLGDVGSFHFTSRGELVLDLKFDSGSVMFR